MSSRRGRNPSIPVKKQEWSGALTRWHPDHVNRRAEPARSLLSFLLAAGRRGRGAVRGGFLGLANLVLPPVCPGCRQPMGDDRGLCVACWSSLAQIEEPWCERLGIPFAYDLGPGTLSAAAIADPPAFDRARSAVIYDGIAPDLVHAFKYADRTELAELIAALMTRAGRELLADCDALVPVPLHPRRLFSRRFNQAALLASVIARRSGRDYRPLLLIRVKQGPQQVGLTRDGRADNVRGAFRVPPHARAEVAGRRILLIDDVLTTGATLEAAARVLRRAGADRVDVLTFARVVAPP